MIRFANPQLANSPDGRHCIEYRLYEADENFLSALLVDRGCKYDSENECFLMEPADFMRWIGRCNRFAAVLDAYGRADGVSRFAAELVAGTSDKPLDGLLCDLERVLLLA